MDCQRGGLVCRSLLKSASSFGYLFTCEWDQRSVKSSRRVPCEAHKRAYKRDLQQRPTIETYTRNLLIEGAGGFWCGWVSCCVSVCWYTVRFDIVWCLSELSNVYPKETYNKEPLTVGAGLYWCIEVLSCVSVCWYIHTLFWHRVVIEWAPQCVPKRDIQKRPTDCRCRSLLMCLIPFLCKFLLIHTLRLDILWWLSELSDVYPRVQEMWIQIIITAGISITTARISRTFGPSHQYTGWVGPTDYL